MYHLPKTEGRIRKYPDGSVQDTIKFKSDRQHLIFEDELDEKTTNIDINVYEPDIDLGEETLQGYVNAYERLDAVRQNLDLIPNAIAVKSLHSDSGKKIQKVQHELDTRVPPSPKIKGRYGLVATVSSNDQGGVSSIYSWDGTITGLPDVYEIHDETFITNTYITQIQQFFNEETGQVEEREVRVPVTFAEDWNGNPIEYYDQNHPVEYIPKMRVYAVTTDDGKRRITPVIKWVPMDYNGQTINPDTTQEQGHDSYSDITNDNTYYDGITENDFSIGD